MVSKRQEKEFLYVFAYMLRFRLLFVFNFVYEKIYKPTIVKDYGCFDILFPNFCLVNFQNKKT